MKRHVGSTLTISRLAADKAMKIGAPAILSLMNDAMAHAIRPIMKMPDAIPLLQRIAEAVEEIANCKDGNLLLSDMQNAAFCAIADLLIRAMPHPTALVRADHSFVAASESYIEMFEFSRRYLSTIRLTELLEEEDRERFLEVNRRLFAGEIRSAVFVGRRMTARGRVILTRSRAWAIADSSDGRPQYVEAVHELLAEGPDALLFRPRSAPKP